MNTAWNPHHSSTVSVHLIVLSFFFYFPLSSEHHFPRESFSPCWETSQWPYLALKFVISFKRSSKPDPTFHTRDHLKPASFKRWICSSNSFVFGFWLFCIFLYDPLTWLHHCPRETVSPFWDTSQWPYLALKAMRSLNRLLKTHPTFGTRDHLKPASFKRWICPSNSLALGFWLFRIFLYFTLTWLHHCAR